MPLAPDRKICRITGSTSRAASPIESPQTGTSRQPSRSQALLAHDLADHLQRRVALARLAGQEGDADRVLALRRQGERGDRAQERVGDLDEHPGAVTDLRVAARSAAVVEVAQRGEALGHDVGTGPAMSVHDEGDATGVVLEPGVVKTLPRRHSCRPSVS